MTLATLRHSRMYSAILGAIAAHYGFDRLSL